MVNVLGHSRVHLAILVQSCNADLTCMTMMCFLDSQYLWKQRNTYSTHQEIPRKGHDKLRSFENGLYFAKSSWCKFSKKQYAWPCVFELGGSRNSVRFISDKGGTSSLPWYYQIKDATSQHSGEAGAQSALPDDSLAADSVANAEATCEAGAQSALPDDSSLVAGSVAKRRSHV